MFEGLTKYIPDLETEEKAARCISKIEDAVYSYAHNNPQYGLKYYRDTLMSSSRQVSRMVIQERLAVPNAPLNMDV